MKTSEMITRLQELLSEHGDLKVVVIGDNVIGEAIDVFVKEEEVWDKTTHTRIPSDNVVYIDSGMY